MNIQKKIVVLYWLLLTSFSAVAGEVDPEMINKAKTMNQSMESHYKDENSFKKNLINPMMGDDTLKTAD